MNPFGDQRTHRLGGLFGLENAATDHSPARLVIVDIGRINERDLKVGFSHFQARGNRNTRSTSTHDHHIIRRVARVGRRFAAIHNPTDNAGHVVACGLGRREDIGNRLLFGHRQRPKRGRARSRPAIGKDRSRQIPQRLAEGRRVRVADPTLADRKIQRL